MLWGHRGPPKPPSHPADLEVLYWRQFKERMAAHRKLQSRGVSGLGTTLGGLGGLQQPLPTLWGCSEGAQGCSSPQEPLWEPELEREAGGEEGAGVEPPKTPNPPCLGSLSSPPGGVPEGWGGLRGH